MIKEYKIQTTKTARYHTLGNLSNDINNVWFVFHGYGQLSEEFLRCFNVLENKETIIVSIEAINKFYFRGFQGKVGASWMTKEDRECEITDYIQLIENVYNNLSADLNMSKIKINVLGFSQGTHTASRWLYYKKIRIDNLILWSGTFPHDCDYKKNAEYWSSFNKFVVRGKKDKLIDNEKFENEIDYIFDQNMNIRVVDFEGGHEIDKNTLLKISNSL